MRIHEIMDIIAENKAGNKKKKMDYKETEYADKIKRNKREKYGLRMGLLLVECQREYI